MKPILEIHEFKEEFKSLPLEDYILAFDDGLYSQYQARDFLKDIRTQKILFVSTNIYRVDEQPNKNKTNCAIAHQKAFSGIFEDYMSTTEIKEMREYGFEIQGHSHFHKKYQISPLKDLYQNLILDTDIMLETFEQLNIKIDKFCFPYNETYNHLYTSVIKKRGLECYGNERIAIEDLLNSLKEK
jgi:hypothetical protein